MGGSPKQVNSGQASQADAAAQQNEQAQANFANQLAGQEKNTYNYLFGADGKSGSLTPMMDPSSLNSATPTGAYSTAYNNATNTLAQNYANQRGSLAQGMANQGFAAGLPSGFQADQNRKLASSQADAQGNLYAGTVAQQHSDALNNFWNANNLASGQAASATSGATGNFSGAGNTEANIYGTAGKQAMPNPLFGQVLGAGIGAGGALGSAGITSAAAACPARGAKVRTKCGAVPVEELRKGVHQIYQSDGSWWMMEEDPVILFGAPCVTVITDEQHRSTVSRTHAFASRAGGFYEAGDCLHRRVRVPRPHGHQVAVIAVNDAGEQDVFDLRIKGNHTYVCDGLWSLA